MKANPKYFFLIGVLILTASFTGHDNYNYRRELKDITDTWHKITIPNELFGKIDASLSDLRIRGINDKGDTIEVPYITDISASEVKKEIPFDLLNQTQNAAGYFYTLDTRSPQEVNRIDLSFEEKNFDWHITLSGSNDQKEWFNLAQDYRILSVKNDLSEYHFTTLKFPTAKYRYYRLMVPATSKPHFLAATITETETIPGAYRPYTIKKVSIENNKKEKHTQIDLQLENTVPVSYLRFKVNNKFDFYRPIRVEYLADSVKTPKGYEYEYASLTNGTISSMETPELRFNNTFASKLRITISNLDNEPLLADSFVVQGSIHRLYARFTQPASYYLFYGNKYADAPNYDIAKFKDRIPADSKELTLGPEESIAASPAPPIHPLFENKAWLWAIMAVIILLLGWFSVKMMRNK